MLTHLEGEPVELAWSQGASCCGDVAERAGLSAQAAETRKRFDSNSTRYKKLISDCAGTTKARNNYASYELVSLADYLFERVETLRRIVPELPREIVLHGGCRERRRWDLGDVELGLLRALGTQVHEAPAHAGGQECCGGELVYRSIAPESAAEMARAALARIDVPPSATLITSAHRCACHFGAQGASVSSLLDLILAHAQVPE